MLVDTSTKYSRRRILRQLPGELEAIFITHAHRDHAGSMHAVATETGAPVWASEGDAAAIEGTAPEPMPAQHGNHIVNRRARPWWTEADTSCFGHGRPLTKNASQQIIDFAAGRPLPEPTPP